MNNINSSALASFTLNSARVIPASAVDALNKEGVVCIRQSITRQWLALIEQGMSHKFILVKI